MRLGNVFFFLVLFLLAGYSCAQTEDQKRNIKYWDEGVLSWEDFSLENFAGSETGIDFSIVYEPAKEKFGDTVVQRYLTRCYMNQKLSWVNPDSRNERYLRYNQLIFDIAELYSRKLQWELNRSGTITNINSIAKEVFVFCHSRIDLLKMESNAGQRTDVIEIWEKEVAAELSKLETEGIPKVNSSSFGYGLHIGFGKGLLTNKLSEHFKSSFNILYGFDLSYKKSILYINGTLAFSSVRKEYFSSRSEHWIKGQNVNIAIVDLSYGYVLLDNENLKLAPFAGLGITEFTAENKDNEEEGLRLVDYNLIFGVNLDYKLRTNIILIPGMINGLKEKSEVALRSRLYISKASYFTDLNGYSINLTLGISGFGKVIKLD